MRPLDDDLVGLREPLRRGEHRPRVAHRDPVAEERADLAPRPRRSRSRRRRSSGAAARTTATKTARLVAAPLTVGAVGDASRCGPREQAAGVVADGVVEARADPVPPSTRSGQTTSRCPSRAAGPADDRGHRDRRLRAHRVGHRRELGEGLGVDRLDEDVEDPAAGQPDGERVVVGDAVALQHRGARRAAPAAPARRPRPRRSRRHAADGLARPARPASTRRAARGADRKVPTTVASADRLAARPPARRARSITSRIAASPSASSSSAARLCPANKLVQRTAARRPFRPCTGA